MFPSLLFFIGVVVLLLSIATAFPEWMKSRLGMIYGAGKIPAPMTESERLCWLFLLIPFAGFVLAVAVTNAYYNRYLITTLPGVAVAFACLISRTTSRWIGIVLLVVLSVSMVWRHWSTVRTAEAIEPPSAMGQQLHSREALNVEPIIVGDQKKYVITDFLLLDQLQYYSKHSGVYAMYQGDDLSMECAYFGDACYTEDSIQKHGTETAAIYPTSKLLADFRKAGYAAKVVMTEPMVVYFSRQ
jgi:hypothetical protein